jgi:hypothetical protein
MINKKVLKEGLDTIENLLADYANEIEEAYSKADGKLTVNLPLSFTPSEGGQIEVKADINFVLSRIKDSQTRLVDPQQMELFPKE